MPAVISRRRFLSGLAATAVLAACDPPMLTRRLLLATGRGPLDTYRRARATRTYAPIDIVCIGDSMTEGYRSTTLAAAWPDVLAGLLATTYSLPSSIYHAGAFGTPLDPPAFALPWSQVGAAPDTTYGLGRKNNVISAGKSMAITENCTGFSIVYTRGPSGSTFGSFKYNVDGGPTTSVSAVNATVQGGRLETVTGLASGSHTVAIIPDSDHVPIEGVVFYDGNERSGFRVWEGGHSGYHASDYIDGSVPHWIDLLGQITPDLAIIMLGRNEWVAGTSVATYIANLTTLIANVRAASSPSPSVMLLAQMQGNHTPGVLWSDFVAGISALVASDGNLAYVDLVPAFGGYTVPPSGALYDADLDHPNDAGMTEIANEIAAVLA